MKMISNEIIEAYRKYLISEEKAPATVEKYIRDIRAFARWLGEKAGDKEAVLQYKSFLSPHPLLLILLCMAEAISSG